MPKLADAAAMAGAVEHTVQTLGRLDVVVASAGVARAGGIDALPAEEIDRMIDVNVRGVLHTIRAALPHLGDGGRIVTIGSVNAARAPFAGAAAYGMTKAAVAGLVRGLARDLGPRGITVNNVQPGPTANDSMSADGPAAQAMTTWLALPRIGTPEEVSALVSHLVGPEGAFITGATLAIDGGFTASSRVAADRRVQLDLGLGLHQHRFIPRRHQCFHRKPSGAVTSQRHRLQAGSPRGRTSGV
ncbi:SDR family oxidoreductase [Nonomuraea sp. NPDC004186]